jgi:hypothetical protein
MSHAGQCRSITHFSQVPARGQAKQRAKDLCRFVYVWRRREGTYPTRTLFPSTNSSPLKKENSQMTCSVQDSPAAPALSFKKANVLYSTVHSNSVALQ